MGRVHVQTKQIHPLEYTANLLICNFSSSQRFISQLCRKQRWQPPQNSAGGCRKRTSSMYKVYRVSQEAEMRGEVDYRRGLQFLSQHFLLTLRMVLIIHHTSHSLVDAVISCSQMSLKSLTYCLTMFFTCYYPFKIRVTSEMPAGCGQKWSI